MIYEFNYIICMVFKYYFWWDFWWNLFLQMPIWHKITFERRYLQIMQLSRKTLQTILSVIKLKVTTSNHQIILSRRKMVLAEHHFPDFLWKFASIYFNCRHGCGNSKRVPTTFQCSSCKVDCWSSHLLAGSLKKRRQENKKLL